MSKGGANPGNVEKRRKYWVSFATFAALARQIGDATGQKMPG